MPIYRVAIWSSIFVDASCIDEAEDVAHDHIIGCLIKPRDFTFDTEIWQDDYAIDDDEIVDAKDFISEETRKEYGQ